LNYLESTFPARGLQLNTRQAQDPRSSSRSKVSDKLVSQPATDNTSSLPNFDRSAGARILARSFYKELRSSGYTPKQLLALSTELIDLITQDLQADRKGAA
jgi:hypothetical protein